MFYKIFRGFPIHQDHISHYIHIYIYVGFAAQYSRRIFPHSELIRVYNVGDGDDGYSSVMVLVVMVLVLVMTVLVMV